MHETVLDRILQPLDMSSRPSYYSGYGAERRHLDENKLIAIWQRTNQVCGPDRADEFAAMVLSLPLLAPTEFLKHFHLLVDNDWQWSDGLIQSGNGVDKTDRPGENWAAACAVMQRIRNKVDGRLVDETESIRAAFSSQIEILTEQRDARIAKCRAEVDALVPSGLLGRF